jgi:glycosyltransferase 2 family protein
MTASRPDESGAGRPARWLPSVILRGALGTLISIVALVVVLGAVNLEAAAEVLAQTAPAWLLFAAFLILVDVLIRAIRWQTLLQPVHPIAYGSMLGYMLVGYLANNVLPARLGELVRSHYLGDREGISRTTTLGTVVVERIVDTAVVVAIAAVAILALGVGGVVTNVVLVGGALAALLVVGLAIVIAAHRLPGAAALAAFVGRWPKARELVLKLREGLAVAGRPRTLVASLFLSAAAWGATLLAFAAAAQAVGLQLGIGEAALLASGVALASAIPAGPGYVGTYELAAVAIASGLGIPAEPAFAMALLVHACILVVTSVGGVIALGHLGWRRRPGAGAIAEPIAERPPGAAES